MPDSIRAVNDLTAAGLPRQSAEAIARLVFGSAAEEFASRRDLADLARDLDRLELDMQKRLDAKLAQLKADLVIACGSIASVCVIIILTALPLLLAR